MSAVFTQWFPPEVKPVYVGWYQRQYEYFDTDTDMQVPDWWDGNNWYVNSGGGLSTTGAYSVLPWRGRVEKPVPNEV